MKAIQTTVTAGDVVIKTHDNRTITVTLHPDRIFVGVSGLGLDSRLEARQIIANGVDIHIRDTGQGSGMLPASLDRGNNPRAGLDPPADEQIRRDNTRRVGDMSS